MTSQKDNFIWKTFRTTAVMQLVSQIITAEYEHIVTHAGFEGSNENNEEKNLHIVSYNNEIM